MDDYLKVPRDEPIPLSVLELDLPVPAIGWSAGLAEKGISTVLDDLGRLCVARSDARRLFDEHREAEVRRREVMAQNERAAEEKDREWRAQLHPGIPWHRMPDGVPPVVAMTAAAKAEQPRRTPSQVEWMFGETDTMVFHSLQDEGDS
jgi:hypothetical protein